MCQEELLMMSQRDRDRLRIIQQVSEGRLSQVDAAEQLGLTARHVRRLVKRLVRRGDGGLIHQSRGKPSHNRFDGNFRQRVLRRYKSRYSDFGPTLAAEKLAEDNMVVAAETLRGWLITGHQNAGLILITIPCGQAHDHYVFRISIWIRNNHPQVAVK